MCLYYCLQGISNKFTFARIEYRADMRVGDEQIGSLLFHGQMALGANYNNNLTASGLL